MKPIYELNDIQYKHILSIDHLSIPKHQITCLKGDSGTGKTTLLKLMMKMISPDHGDIFYDGTHVHDIQSIDLRKKVLFLPQKAYIFPDTIKANLTLGLHYHGKAYDDQMLESVLHTVRLDKSLNDDANVLSGGEQQRLALARLLLLDGETYILDEPSSALDATSEDIIIEAVVSHIRNHNKTLILVTHNMKNIENHADHVVDLNQMKAVKS